MVVPGRAFSGTVVPGCSSGGATGPMIGAGGVSSSSVTSSSTPNSTLETPVYSWRKSSPATGIVTGVKRFTFQPPALPSRPTFTVLTGAARSRV